MVLTITADSFEFFPLLGVLLFALLGGAGWATPVPWAFL